LDNNNHGLGFDPETTAMLYRSREAVLAGIVRDMPQYENDSALVAKIDRALSELAMTGQRDPERLMQYADYQARIGLDKRQPGDARGSFERG
jgi:hypothetical protein